jgi:hypothetical protein
MRWLAALVLALAGPAAAQEADDWTRTKCAFYSEAWAQATAGEGLAGIGPEFRAAHAEFLGSGCTIRGAVCPRNPQELRLADMLSLMAVAEGMAGSFLPFRCPRQGTRPPPSANAA